MEKLKQYSMYFVGAIVCLIVLVMLLENWDKPMTFGNGFMLFVLAAFAYNGINKTISIFQGFYLQNQQKNLSDSQNILNSLSALDGEIKKIKWSVSDIADGMSREKTDLSIIDD